MWHEAWGGGGRKAGERQRHTHTQGVVGARRSRAVSRARAARGPEKPSETFLTSHPTRIRRCNMSRRLREGRLRDAEDGVQNGFSGEWSF